MKDVRNVLVVEVSPELFDVIAPVLERKEFEVDRFPHAGGALELLAVVPFAAVIVGFPLREVPVEQFLDAIRSGPSAAAKVALLSTVFHHTKALALLGHGVDLALQVEKAPKEAIRLLCALLGVPPRAAVRIMVKLESRLDHGLGGERILAQTFDLSASGMLVATRRRFPVGSTVRFELVLPEGHAHISGEAEVARHAEATLKRPEGMGLRFSKLSGDGQAQLQRYLDGLAPAR